MFCLWWIALGIASSIGLGTGLHTFLLYTGPHIAKVTMASNECGYVPTHYPSRWNFDHFEECSSQLSQFPSFFEVYKAVIIEASLWGLGTAIGELPPYFVSRAGKLTKSKRIASIAGKKNEELEEMIQDDKLNANFSSLGIKDKIMITMYKLLKNHAFVVVTLAASVSIFLIVDSEPLVRSSWSYLRPLLNSLSCFLWSNFHRQVNNQNFITSNSGVTQ